MLSLWCCVHDWYWWKGKFNCVKQWKSESVSVQSCTWYSLPILVGTLSQCIKIIWNTFSVYQYYLILFLSVSRLFDIFLSTWCIKIIWHTFSVVYQDAAQLPWVASRFLLPNCTYVVSNELPSFTTSIPYHTIPYQTIPYQIKLYHTYRHKRASFLPTLFLSQIPALAMGQSEWWRYWGRFHSLYLTSTRYPPLTFPQIQTQPLVFIGTTSTSIQGVTQSNSWSPNFLNIHEYHDSFFAAMNSTHN